MSSILDLNNDILVGICSCLPPRSVWRLTQICADFYARRHIMVSTITTLRLYLSPGHSHISAECDADFWQLSPGQLRRNLSRFRSFLLRLHNLSALELKVDDIKGLSTASLIGQSFSTPPANISLNWCQNDSELESDSTEILKLLAEINPTMLELPIGSQLSFNTFIEGFHSDRLTRLHLNFNQNRLRGVSRSLSGFNLLNSVLTEFQLSTLTKFPRLVDIRLSHAILSCFGLDDGLPDRQFASLRRLEFHSCDIFHDCFELLSREGCRDTLTHLNLTDCLSTDLPTLLSQFPSLFPQLEVLTIVGGRNSEPIKHPPVTPVDLTQFSRLRHLTLINADAWGDVLSGVKGLPNSLQNLHVT